MPCRTTVILETLKDDIFKYKIYILSIKQLFQLQKRLENSVNTRPYDFAHLPPEGDLMLIKIMLINPSKLNHPQ